MTASLSGTAADKWNDWILPQNDPQAHILETKPGSLDLAGIRVLHDLHHRRDVWTIYMEFGTVRCAKMDSVKSQPVQCEDQQADPNCPRRLRTIESEVLRDEIEQHQMRTGKPPSNFIEDNILPSDLLR